MTSNQAYNNDPPAYAQYSGPVSPPLTNQEPIKAAPKNLSGNLEFSIKSKIKFIYHIII
jgi:hypothetical protein